MLQPKAGGVKVISERNLDEKTIARDADKIKVKVAETAENALEVSDEGLIVKHRPTVEFVSLGGIDLGGMIKLK